MHWAGGGSPRGLRRGVRSQVSVFFFDFLVKYGEQVGTEQFKALNFSSVFWKEAIAEEVAKVSKCFPPLIVF